MPDVKSQTQNIFLMIKPNYAPDYLSPDAKEVDILAASIVCTSPDSQITSITEPDEDLGVWE